LPALLPDQALNLTEITWADELSVQRHLKRIADVFVALPLLLVTLPLILLAGLLIRLEDRGPIFFVQTRSGLMGRIFRVYKLRTMRVADPNEPASWTVSGDERITLVGWWFLRRTRLDELPQLCNVLKGDMSLIGPRPERPELEHELEEHIPHYRKRHWMPPGLSGWAQVCAPYVANVREAELKLSDDQEPRLNSEGESAAPRHRLHQYQRHTHVERGVGSFFKSSDNALWRQQGKHGQRYGSRLNEPEEPIGISGQASHASCGSCSGSPPK
jgi:lipopolysaccharide/colanic/teichoic acid biosynthesis glycosyltransferase